MNSIFVVVEGDCTVALAVGVDNDLVVMDEYTVTFEGCSVVDVDHGLVNKVEDRGVTVDWYTVTVEGGSDVDVDHSLLNKVEGQVVTVVRCTVEVVSVEGQGLRIGFLNGG